MDKSQLCPTCGQALGSGWERRESLTVALGKTLQSGGSYERRAPARIGNLRGDLVLPLGQASVTALVGAILGGILSGWRIGLVAGGVMFAGAWLLLLWDHRRALWVVERINGRDLDHDGAVGKAKPDPPIILRAHENWRTPERVPVVTVSQDVTNPNRRLALDLAEFITRGHRDGFGIRDWTGRVLSTGTRVSDGTWREWTALLKEAGILESDQSGTRLGMDLDTALKSIITDWR